MIIHKDIRKTWWSLILGKPEHDAGSGGELVKLEVGLRVAPLVVPVQLVAAAEREAEDGQGGGREDGVDGATRIRRRHLHCGSVRSPSESLPGGVALSRRV